MIAKRAGLAGAKRAAAQFEFDPFPGQFLNSSQPPAHNFPGLPIIFQRVNHHKVTFLELTDLEGGLGMHPGLAEFGQESSVDLFAAARKDSSLVPGGPYQ